MLHIIAAIALHNFAMEHEGNSNFELDEFFKAGQAIMELERFEKGLNDLGNLNNTNAVETSAGRTEALRLGKRRRNEIKNKLFQYLDN